MSMSQRRQAKGINQPKSAEEQSKQLQIKIKGVLESLSANVPFEKVDVEKIVETFNEGDPGVEAKMKGRSNVLTEDDQYRYCYQNLLIETKEWTTLLGKFLIFAQSQPKEPQPIAEQTQSKEELSKKNLSSRREKEKGVLKSSQSKIDDDEDNNN